MTSALWKGLWARPGAVFAAVFLWKLALLLALALPMPSNDSFFYDGPVVNLLLHGKYANPALAPALPISGTELFCAYPPLYQALLLGWMWLFGPTVIAAMALHLVLFGSYMLLLLAVFRRLAVPGWAGGVAAAFLLVITFDDRPDSLAHVLGIAALYAWLRSRPWSAAALAILAFATSLQLGALYACALWLGMLAQGALRPPGRVPWAPMLAMVAAPMALAILVAVGFPGAWAGFMEHARQTPSLTGWRWPQLDALLKIARHLPGILAAAALLPWLWRTHGPAGTPELQNPKSDPGSESAQAPPQTRSPGGPGAFGFRIPDSFRISGDAGLVTLAALLAALAVVGASLCLLTPNSVLFVAPVQPLIVGGCLAWAAARHWAQPRLRACARLFLALAAIGSVRAVGMTTWGAACAADAGYPSALRRVQAELSDCPPGSTVVLSSAYLYEAARHPALRWIHSDWMEPAQRGRPSDDWTGLLNLRPAKLLLSQFDYYRRYQPLVEQLKARPDLARVHIVNTARCRAPDSFRPLQRVLQHICWAPVVLELRWR